MLLVAGVVVRIYLVLIIFCTCLQFTLFNINKLYIYILNMEVASADDEFAYVEVLVPIGRGLEPPQNLPRVAQGDIL